MSDIVCRCGHCRDAHNVSMGPHKSVAGSCRACACAQFNPWNPTAPLPKLDISLLEIQRTEVTYEDTGYCGVTHMQPILDREGIYELHFDVVAGAVRDDLLLEQSEWERLNVAIVARVLNDRVRFMVVHKAAVQD